MILLKMFPLFGLYRNLFEEERREENRELKIRRKILRDASNPFEMPEMRFIELYRLNKDCTRNLMPLITIHLRDGYRQTYIPKELRVFACLRFYATGCYQRSVGNDFNISVSQTIVSRMIHEVTDVIENHLTPIWIKFPQTIAERNSIKERVMFRFQFPGTIGFIDCTHVAILKPTVDPQNYKNRKGYYSKNVQLICDDNLRILNVNAGFGGSTHDAFIWRQSRVKDYLQNLNENNERCWLLGDSGYPLSTNLLTPYRNPPEGSPEQRFNTAHIRARNCIERCNGVLKARFRCILKERVARYDQQFVGRIINACAVLHNICIQANLQIPQEEMDDGNDNGDFHANGNDEQNHEGQIVRDQIAHNYFA